MQVNNIQNYNYNQKPSFKSSIVPNETIGNLLDLAHKKINDDRQGLGEDYKNLLVCMNGILNDGRNDVIEIGEDKNGFAYLKINDKEYSKINGILNYSYNRKNNGEFSKEFDGHGSYEQILDFAQNEKGVNLPYKPHQKSFSILEEDKNLVLPELNELNALTYVNEESLILARNLISQIRCKIKSKLIKDLNNLKAEIFSPNIDFIGENKIMLEEGLEGYGEQLAEALNQNPAVRRFFKSYDAKIFLGYEEEATPDGKLYYRTTMEISYKHPLTRCGDNWQDCTPYRDDCKIVYSTEGKDIEKCFNKLINDISARYKFENLNTISNKLNKEHNRIQREIQKYEADMQAKNAKRLKYWQKRFAKSQRGEE